MTCVGMGNPHAITFVDDLDEVNLAAVGPLFEKHPVFPAKTNTEFVQVCTMPLLLLLDMRNGKKARVALQVLSPTHLKMKVWERGAGPTLACGTGACALAVAAVLTGKAERSCKVTLPGGDLHIEWRESNNRIYMTGGAEQVFSGAYLR